MKISHFMLTVSAVIFAWLTASYLRPIPQSSYEHAGNSLAFEAAPASETTTSLVSDIPLAGDTVVVK